MHGFAEPQALVPPSHRLNLFQRMMLRWRSLHPYNPVHVVRIAAALDAARLQSLIQGELEATGLTGLELSADGTHARWRGGPAQVVLQRLAPRPTAQDALHAAIEQSFNEPFVRGAAGDPFRFFVIDEGEGFSLGLAYDHFVAGGDAIAVLLSEIALAYLGSGKTRPALHAGTRPRTYRHLLANHPAWTAHALAGLPRMAASSRRASRTPMADVEDGRNGYASLSLTVGETRALLASAKAWGVTLNDLLLAALLLVLAPRSAASRSAARRNELAVASIMNIRRDFADAASTWPSPCLAALRVGHAVPEGVGLQALATDVHVRTAAIKHEHLYLQSLLALGLTSLAWRWLKPHQRHAWLPKHYPTAAGVTTLNLNPLWSGADPAVAARLDYLRAVPTGPLCPIVLAATTAHGILHLGLSYRCTAYTAEEMTRLTEDLHACLLPALCEDAR